MKFVIIYNYPIPPLIYFAGDGIFRCALHVIKQTQNIQSMHNDMIHEMLLRHTGIEKKYSFEQEIFVIAVKGISNFLYT